MVDKYEGFRELDLTKELELKLSNIDKVIARDDLYTAIENDLLYFVWLNTNGSIMRCVCIHRSTFVYMIDELQDITPIRIKGVRGRFGDNHCPEHLINYYMLGNCVGKVNLNPSIDKQIKVVWYSNKEMKSVCVSVNRMKGESGYMVELFHLDGNKKRIDNRLIISYEDLTSIINSLR